MLMFWATLAGAGVLLMPGMAAAWKAAEPGTLDRPTHRGWRWTAVVCLVASALLIVAAMFQGSGGEVLASLDLRTSYPVVASG